MASKRSWSTFGPTFLNGGTGWSSDAAVALLRSTVRNLMKTSERDGEKTASASVVVESTWSRANDDAVFELVDASFEGVVGKRCTGSFILRSTIIGVLGQPRRLLAAPRGEMFVSNCLNLVQLCSQATNNEGVEGSGSYKKREAISGMVTRHTSGR